MRKLSPTDVIEKFWKNVDKTGDCWLWRGATDSYGMPIINAHNSEGKRRSMLAQRYSYELYSGRFLFTDEYVYDTCGSKTCVNPGHLTIRPRKQDERERFWSHVIKLSETNSGCWIWTGTLNQEGYGVFSVDSLPVRAHRYSWQLANSHHISTPLLFVCHKCDVRACVNPDHLFLGESYENTQDMVNKGRQALGEKHGKARLTEEDIPMIRQSPLTNSELANQFGVTRQAINRIRKRLNWKQVA